MARPKMLPGGTCLNPINSTSSATMGALPRDLHYRRYSSYQKGVSPWRTSSTATTCVGQKHTHLRSKGALQGRVGRLIGVTFQTGAEIRERRPNRVGASRLTQIASVGVPIPTLFGSARPPHKPRPSDGPLFCLPSRTRAPVAGVRQDQTMTRRGGGREPVESLTPSARGASGKRRRRPAQTRLGNIRDPVSRRRALRDGVTSNGFRFMKREHVFFLIEAGSGGTSSGASAARQHIECASTRRHDQVGIFVMKVERGSPCGSAARVIGAFLPHDIVTA